MRILFLSHYFPPEVNAPASRTFEHCRHWVEQGHKVTVLTCAPNHPRGEVYDGYKNKLFRRENIDGIEVIRTWTYVTANEGFVKRTLNYISFMVMCIFLSPWLAKTDIVISTSPQFFNGLAGYFVSRIKRVPWVLEIRDLWPESIVAVGAINNQRIVSLLEWLEMFAYKKCNHIVPVTDAFKAYMVDKGIGAEKITVIKNGVDLSLYQTPTDLKKDELPAELHNKNGMFIAAYVGTHGMAHHLETVLDAAEILKDEPKILFLMVGDGAERKQLLLQKQERGLTNVLMLDQQPKSAMPFIWNKVDVSLVLLRKLDLFKTVIPSKIFESMAMNKPIVIGVEGESQGIIENAKAGISIEPENAEQLAESVRLLSQDEDLYKKMALNGRDYVATHYNRSKLAAKYSKLLVTQSHTR